MDAARCAEAKLIIEVPLLGTAGTWRQICDWVSSIHCWQSETVLGGCGRTRFNECCRKNLPTVSEMTAWCRTQSSELTSQVFPRGSSQFTHKPTFRSQSAIVGTGQKPSPMSLKTDLAGTIHNQQFSVLLGRGGAEQKQRE